MKRILNLRHVCIVACALALGCADGAPDTQTANGGETDALISPTPDVGQIAADAGVGSDASASVDAASLPTDMMAPEPEDTWADDVDEMVDRLGRLPEPGTEPGTTTIGAASAPERDGNFLCVEQEISETAQYAEYVATQANSNALWVGALIQGQALSNGMFTEVALPRAPMRISVGAENLTGQASAELEAPSLSAYRDAVRGILSNGLQGSQAAQVNYSTETIHSEEHMALSMGADVNAGNVDVMASFDFTRDDIRSRVVVNFTQAYYTVDMDAVAGAHAFFEPGTDISDIANAFGGADATAPLYVSSITYGRRVVFTAESTANAQELKAALDFAYDGLANNVSVEARMSHAEVLESSTIRAFILGGNPDDAVQAVQGIEGIQAFIRDGGTFSADSPGAPIGYKLNHLSDNSTARLSLTTDYTKEVCERVGQNIKVTLLGITPVNGQNNPMTYGTIYTRSFNDSGDEARRHVLFSKSLDERVQMRDGERWSESNTGRSGTLPCVASLAEDAVGAVIHIDIQLRERDPLGRDDDVTADYWIPPRDGWRRGCGHGNPLRIRATSPRQDFDVDFCLEPVSDTE